VERIRDLIMVSPAGVQSEMTAALAVLALSDELKPRLLKMGVLSVLIPLTQVSSAEVQGNSAAALGNLSSKIQDYSAFVSMWEEPAGGLHNYLVRFLESQDTTFQHIAVWTVVQFIEGEDPRLLQNISTSKTILPLIAKLTTSEMTPVPTPTNPSNNSAVEESGDENEIAGLARKVLGTIRRK